MLNKASPPARVLFRHRLPPARSYQDRPEFAEICDWWAKGGAGVLALVGMGGAGKTALVDHFLRVLPGAMIEDSRLPKQSHLVPPEGVFIYSFYQDSNVDNFWVDLHSWCVSDFHAAEETQLTAEKIQDALRQLPAPILLVLDGLERIQDPGGPGRNLGRLQDKAFREFILRVADANLRLSILITTRFSLFEPLQEGSTCYKEVEIQTLTPIAAIRLLRSRGVIGGSDYDLELLAQDHGWHALTIDLIGGYIGHFCLGEPSRLPPIPRDLLEEEREDTDPEIAWLRKQEKRFARVAERYRETLEERDPACLALLQRVCLFPLGVSAARLVDFFVGEDREKISGAELAALHPDQLLEKLDWLVRMHILEVVERPGENAYTVHAVVRDKFRLEISATEARAGHRKIRKSIEAVLGGRPGERYPSDPHTLDLLQEITLHAIGSGDFEDAWNIYSRRMGGFKNLGWRLGDFQRGERICRAFTLNRPPEAVSLPKAFSGVTQARFLNDWACYLLRLGRLGDAALCYRRMMGIPIQLANYTNASIAWRNLAEVHLLAGHLTEGLKLVEESLQFADKADDHAERADSHGCRGYIYFLQGRSNDAKEEFDESLRWQRRFAEPDKPLFGRRAVRYAEYLLICGNPVLVRQLAQEDAEEEWDESDESGNISWRWVLFSIDHALGKGDLSIVEQKLEKLEGQIRKWDAKEPLCRWLLARSRLFLARSKYPGEDRLDWLAKASREIELGLKMAKESSYGLLCLDFLIARARLYLLSGDFGRAGEDVRRVLCGTEENLLFKAESPKEFDLLHARHPDCGYVWAAMEARLLLGEALLLEALHLRRKATRHLRIKEWVAEALRSLIRRDVLYGRIYRQTPISESLISQAVSELNASLGMRRSVGDVRVHEIEARLREIGAGKLSHFPSEFVTLDEQGVKEQERSGGQEDYLVFISHNRKDDDWAVAIADTLKQRGFNVWLDTKNLVAGQEWLTEIDKSISRASAVLILISPSGRSFWTDREIQFAWDARVKRNIPIIPILLPGTTQDEIPSNLRILHWVNLHGGLTAASIERILQGIRTWEPTKEAP